MGTNSQKERAITEQEARTFLLQQMANIAWPKYPLAWVGDLVEEDDVAFTFEAAIHAEGEDPRDECVHWHVVKRDGRCVAAMA